MLIAPVLPCSASMTIPLHPRSSFGRRARSSTAALAFFLLPLAASCGSQDEAGRGGGEGAPIDEAALSDERLLAEVTARQNAAAQGLVASAMAALVDPAKALYRNVRPGLSGSACGEVSTPSGKEAASFRPFVVTPEGVAIISPTPSLGFRDPNDIFPDLYIRWCATPDELQKIEPELKRGPLSEDELNAVAGESATPPLPEPSIPIASTPPPGAAPPAGSNPERIDRFEEAVRRKQQ